MAREREILPFSPELFDSCAELVALASGLGLTVGTAESCTGGLVSGCLTAVPGSSSVVRGGITSYAIPVKHDVLGVPYDGLLDVPEVGAVSSECAQRMADGARRVLCCDVAVSITGIAGPGGEEPGKPVGTVWMGLSSGVGCKTFHNLFDGDRADVRIAAVRRAVELLREGVVELSNSR